MALTRLLGNKLDNLTTLVANVGLWQYQHAERAWMGGFLGYARIAEVNDLLPAAGPLLLGVVGLFLLDLYSKRVRLFGYRTIKF